MALPAGLLDPDVAHRSPPSRLGPGLFAGWSLRSASRAKPSDQVQQQPSRNARAGADEAELYVQSLIPATGTQFLQELEADEEADGADQRERGGPPGSARPPGEHQVHEEPEEQAPEEMPGIFIGNQANGADHRQIGRGGQEQIREENDPTDRYGNQERLRSLASIIGG